LVLILKNVLLSNKKNYFMDLVINEMT